ncbi:conserved protein of unknown function [Methanocaldococcus lauensis]|uniref:Uncharacterized protein n=1 Tax=Methanocaldococcus lauensis TaxID=2546128 RepID=A0A8D6PNU4_9EURY|nr:hypothetical protein [Methanocaldococcus lauensis]CAB3287121.1 conserved protein of unknown function [Methanocaldococcus lauensis]CAB3289536.1 conserved protein of unknown function [Methanocaldococcus lauensis]
MDLTILYVIVFISLLLNIILGIKVIQLQKELENVKRATRLTKEEVEKLNERLRKLKIEG